MFVPVIDAFNAAQGMTREAGGPAGVFFTHPGEHVTPLRSFLDEIALTGILLLGTLASTAIVVAIEEEAIG